MQHVRRACSLLEMRFPVRVSARMKHSVDALLSSSPNDFISSTLANGNRRLFIAYDQVSRSAVASDPSFAPFSEHFDSDKINYNQHEGVFLEVGRRSNALMGAFIWRTNRGQACGGIRMWNYTTMQDFLTDGLRLSVGMGRKSALAGLWAGGGKGLIHAPPNHKDLSVRRDVFHDYGDFLTSLQGCYIGAEDVGLTVSDLDFVHERTRFVTCISPQLGGSGNPSGPTGHGVVSSMEAALDFRNMGSLEANKIVIQGAGNVATIIIDELLRRKVGQIVASECDGDRYNQAVQKYSNDARVKLIKTEVGDLSALYEECDILAPCALGGVINEETIPELRAPIICGAANNQLSKPRDNEALERRGITFVVDFVANRMGIVNCANETYGYIDQDPFVRRHFEGEWENSIYKIVTRVLQSSRDQGVTPVVAADQLADKLSLEPHPVWGHRPQKIIQSLIASQWHKNSN